MHPVQTLYRLESPADAEQIARLPGGREPRTFPTIVAVRGKKVLGFMGTHARRDVILAGPMAVLDLPRRSKGIIAWRLIQAYEVALAHAGVTHYHFTVDDPVWAAAVTRSGLAQQYAEDEDFQYFVRHVGLRKVQVH